MTLDAHHHEFSHDTTLSIALGPMMPIGETDVIAAFDAQVAMRQDANALEWGDGALSYGALDQQARDLAQTLLQNGVEAGDIVGIQMPRGPQWIVGLLAILRAGCCYLPLNPQDPSARLKMLIEDAAIKHIVRVSGEEGTPIVVRTDITDQIPGRFADTEECPAYVMYTSGSTGKPKGVIVSHNNVLRLVASGNVVPLSPATRMLQTGAATFDAVTFEIWGTLLNGGCLILCEDSAILSASRLGQILSDHQANTMWLTSPLFSILAAEQPEIFQTLSYLIVGGDVVVRKHVDRVYETSADLVVVNGYGPTENTTFSTMHPIARNDQEANIPIGLPLVNSSTYVLDAQQVPVAKGVQGELFLGGDGVALGYLNRPEQTKAVFVQDAVRGQFTMYRTGDLAVMQQDGTIVFHGRVDTQIKLRGFRIELGEIENCLRSHPMVSDAVLIHDQAHVAGPRLLAYAVADAIVTDMDIREHLASRLPHYMLPHVIIPMDDFPLTSHGKVDRRALPAPEELDYLGAQYVAPETGTQKTIAQIISQAVGIQAVGLRDSFFDLGVDSLSAARIATVINKTLGVQLSSKDMLTNPSLEGVSALIGDKAISVASQPAASPINAQVYEFALTQQQRALYAEQVKEPETVRYNVPVLLPLPSDVDLDRFERAVSHWIARHDILRIAMPLAEPPRQVISAAQEVEIPRFDSAPDPQALIQPFDIHTGPLWRASLHRSRDSWQVFFDFHHLIVDGPTLEVLIGDLSHLYHGDTLPAVTQRLSDFVVWESQGAGSQLRQAQRAFWQSRLWNVAPAESLPMDFTRAGDRTRKGGSVSFSFDPTLIAQCKTRAAKLHLTLAQYFGAIYGLFLARATGMRDITYGTPTHMRLEAGFENVCGMLANTVCIAVKVQEQDALTPFLQQAGRVFCQSLEHQAFTFGDLVDLTGATGSAGRNPLFDTMFAFQVDADLATDFLGQRVSLRPLHPGEAMFDLSLQVYQTEAGLDAEWEYDASLFEPETVEALRDIFVELLEYVCVASDDTSLAQCLSQPAPDAPAQVALEFDF